MQTARALSARALTLRACGGSQVDSKLPSEPMPGFGTGSRDTARKVFISNDHAQDRYGSQSPGPAASYKQTPAFGKQVSSRIHSAPSWGFGSQNRWAEYDREIQRNTTPGPGTY